MSLFAGTLLLRPYVFLFLAAFLVCGVRDIGIRRTAIFMAWAWPVAFVAEVLSTRIGIPFGLYHYTGDTRGQELFISNVPFFDPLSFVFLAYAAYCLARVALERRNPLSLTLVSGALMMLLDVVIDPLAVRGDRWFLGHIFWYANGGVYFGVPLSNFLGWWIVGAVSVGGYLWLTRGRAEGRRPIPGVGLYYGVLLFNLVMTAWIGEYSLLMSGVVLHLALGVALAAVRS
jgi:uncharacterized membrane protein